jgi:hypothetical protein
MKECWNEDPQNRPKAKQIHEKVNKWRFEYLNEEEFNNANRYTRQQCSKKSHPGAVYHSRIIPHITRPAFNYLHKSCCNEDIVDDNEWEQLVSISNFFLQYLNI